MPIDKFKCTIDQYGSEVIIEWSHPRYNDTIKDFFLKSFDSEVFNNSTRILYGIFISRLDEVRDFLNVYPDLSNIFSVDNDLKQTIINIPRYNDVIKNKFILTDEEIEKKLKKSGFIRKLKSYQLRNVSKMIQFPSCASFSVPGAGKTTEALAYYIIKRKSERSKILIISPLNAFTAWDEEIPECLDGYQESSYRVERLRGSDNQEYKRQLELDKLFYIVNYEKIRNDMSFLKLMTMEFNNPDKEYFIILDESHKMKGPETGKFVNFFAPLVKNKIILSGTPMPQEHKDLYNQFNFLFPKDDISDPNLLAEKFKPVFVRTTKGDLDLPEVNEEVVPVKMTDAQKKIYNLMLSSILRRNYDLFKKEDLRAFKKSTMRMIQFFSNPLLQLKYIDNIDPLLARELEEEGEGNKMKQLIFDVEKLTKEGKKALIWSSFPKNIDLMNEHLSHLNAVSVHGKIPIGNINTPSTREYNINKFKNDPSCMVFIANPAAASEGISLHKVCANAFYLDRNYNAAHYLQSKDRIHRIGMDKNTKVNIKIYQSGKDSIDHHIENRLFQKCSAMADFLNDKGIIPRPQILDSYEGYDQEEEYNEDKIYNETYSNDEDSNSLMSFFKKLNRKTQ